MVVLKRPIGAPSDIQPLCVNHYMQFIMHAADVSFPQQAYQFQPGELQHCVVINLCMDPDDLESADECLPCKWGSTDTDMHRAIVDIRDSIEDIEINEITDIFMSGALEGHS